MSQKQQTGYISFTSNVQFCTWKCVLNHRHLYCKTWTVYLMPDPVSSFSINFGVKQDIPSSSPVTPSFLTLTKVAFTLLNFVLTLNRSHHISIPALQKLAGLLFRRFSSVSPCYLARHTFCKPHFGCTYTDAVFPKVCSDNGVCCISLIFIG